jgi:hypothetical protein
MDTDTELKFKKVLLFIAMGMSFALLDEMYQKLIPGRKFNIIDFMYDSIGFSIGIFSMFLIAVVKNKPEKLSEKIVKEPQITQRGKPQPKKMEPQITQITQIITKN